MKGVKGLGRGTVRGTDAIGLGCLPAPRLLSWTVAVVASVSVGSYHGAMSAQSAEQHLEDPLDPQWILRELPGQERANFLAAYREALDGARDPAGWGHLRRVLRLWSGVVIAANRPGFYEAQEAALAGTGGGMLLEDYIRLRRTQA